MKIYNNTISNSETGIDIDKESSNNAIHNNTIIVADTTHSQLPVSDGLYLLKREQRRITKYIQIIQ